MSPGRGRYGQQYALKWCSEYRWNLPPVVLSGTTDLGEITARTEACIHLLIDGRAWMRDYKELNRSKPRPTDLPRPVRTSGSRLPGANCLLPAPGCGFRAGERPRTATGRRRRQVLNDLLIERLGVHYGDSSDFGIALPRGMFSVSAFQEQAIVQSISIRIRALSHAESAFSIAGGWRRRPSW